MGETVVPLSKLFAYYRGLDLPQNFPFCQAEFEIDGRTQTIHSRFVFGQDFECRAQRSQHFGASVAVRTSIAKTAERVFVVVDGFAVQVQNARAIARATQVAHRTLAIVATAEMQGE